MGPRVEPVAEGISRPMWSVMIPTFNCARLLATTLGSVLSQDPGPAVMQIEVVDDCSTRDEPEAVVRSLGAGRVGFYRQPSNVGVTRNFNTCIERSVGHLVHLLNGDDWIQPGFYERVELSARRHPQVAFFITRSFVFDDEGNLDSLSVRVPSLERPSRDISPFLYANPLCTPGIVVRRQFYEALGAFLLELGYTSDWEMWVRAISIGGGCAINQPLACYRRHASNLSNQLARSSENLRDFLRLCEVFQVRFGGFNRKAFLRMVANVANAQARRFRQVNDAEAAAANESLCRDLAQMLTARENG